jgi:hypothetical protein
MSIVYFGNKRASAIDLGNKEPPVKKQKREHEDFDFCWNRKKPKPHHFLNITFSYKHYSHWLIKRCNRQDIRTWRRSIEYILQEIWGGTYIQFGIFLVFLSFFLFTCFFF